MQETTLLFYFGTGTIQIPEGLCEYWNKEVSNKDFEISARIESLKEPQKIQKRYSLECSH